MIKLLIVDDSALMRRQLASVFEVEPGFVVRQARNGRDAVEQNREFQPDVITLDINMPEMDGVTALSVIMSERPTAVVMVSSLTERGALVTFEALNLGAIDYITKPGGTISLSLGDIKDELIRKVRTAAKARLRSTRATPARFTTAAAGRAEARAAPVPRVSRRADAAREGVVLIGVSTGGPRTLEEILPLLPAEFPWPVLVAQHMPAAFTKTFAARLNNVCALTVVEVSQPHPLERGTIYVGKGGADMVLGKRGNSLLVLARPEQREHLWHPSVELMGRSALEYFPAASIIGVMLTGMGYDGSDAFAEIKARGGRTIAESEETAVVFGMPAELIERGGATITLPAHKVAGQLNVWAGR